LENGFSKISLQLPYSTDGNGTTPRAANPEGGAASHSPHQHTPTIPKAHGTRSSTISDKIMDGSYGYIYINITIYVYYDSPKKIEK
jgi:hypothetical protein